MMQTFLNRFIFVQIASWVCFRRIHPIVLGFVISTNSNRSLTCWIQTACAPLELFQALISVFYRLGYLSCHDDHICRVSVYELRPSIKRTCFNICLNNSTPPPLIDSRSVVSTDALSYIFVNVHLETLDQQLTIHTTHATFHWGDCRAWLQTVAATWKQPYSTRPSPQLWIKRIDEALLFTKISFYRGVRGHLEERRVGEGGGFTVD